MQIIQYWLLLHHRDKRLKPITRLIQENQYLCRITVLSLHIPDSEFDQKIQLNESKRLELLLSFAALALQRGEERSQRMTKGHNSFNQISNLYQRYFKISKSEFTVFTCTCPGHVFLL